MSLYRMMTILVTTDVVDKMMTVLATTEDMNNLKNVYLMMHLANRILLYIEKTYSCINKLAAKIKDCRLLNNSKKLSQPFYNNNLKLIKLTKLM